MATYDAQIALAQRLIAKKGAMAVVTRPATGTFDPISQTATAAPLSDTFAIVELPLGRSAEFRIGTLEGRNIRQFYIAQRGNAAKMVVTKGDVVTWQGKSYKLIWSETYDPAADGAILTIAYGEI